MPYLYKFDMPCLYKLLFPIVKSEHFIKFSLNVGATVLAGIILYLLGLEKIINRFDTRIDSIYTRIDSIANVSIVNKGVIANISMDINSIDKITAENKGTITNMLTSINHISNMMVNISGSNISIYMDKIGEVSLKGQVADTALREVEYHNRNFRMDKEKDAIPTRIPTIQSGDNIFVDEIPTLWLGDDIVINESPTLLLGDNIFTDTTPRLTNYVPNSIINILNNIQPIGDLFIDIVNITITDVGNIIIADINNITTADIDNIIIADIDNIIIADIGNITIADIDNIIIADIGNITIADIGNITIV